MASTRDRIMASTNELFRRNGYHGTSLSQISAASGATTGSIYHFFPEGKQALTAEVIATTGAVYRELFESILAGAGAETGVDDPAEAYAEFFAAAAVTLEESDFIDPCPIGTIAREVASTNDILRTAAAAVFESWIDAGRHHLERAGLDRADAERLASVIVATVEGTFVVSRTLRDIAPLAAAGRTVADLVRTSIDAAARGRTAAP